MTIILIKYTKNCQVFTWLIDTYIITEQLKNISLHLCALQDVRLWFLHPKHNEAASDFWKFRFHKHFSHHSSLLQYLWHTCLWLKHVAISNKKSTQLKTEILVKADLSSFFFLFFLFFSFSIFVSVELRVWEEVQPETVYFSFTIPTMNPVNVLYKIYFPYNFIKLWKNTYHFSVFWIGYFNLYIGFISLLVYD